MVNLKVKDTAQSYFQYMEENFPIMCSSDEFYFFPRAKGATDYLDRLDSLDKDRIKDHIGKVKELLRNLEESKVYVFDLDEKIDYELLRSSMLSFLRDFSEIKIWQRAAHLYLKVALLGLDEIISSEAIDADRKRESMLSRMRGFPRIISEAQRNLKRVPEVYRQESLEILDGAVQFLKAYLNEFLKSKLKAHGEFRRINITAQEKLLEFEGYLKKLSCQRRFAYGKETLEKILKESFLVEETLEQVYEISQREIEDTLKEIKELAFRVDHKKSWQEILADYKLNVRTSYELLKLYNREVKSLKNFLKVKDVLSVLEDCSVKVIQTPPYLRPIRATASYSSPSTKSRQDKALFYVTIFEKDLAVHKEYLFMSAHETYPGHHLLDMYRKRQKNVVRRLIESPLFYEGWASYAEQLIDELGYTQDPRQKLVQLRRQLWRATRALLDIQLHTEKINLSQAKRALVKLGYEHRIAHLMARHYCLSCGYQLCYTLGRYKINNLRNEFLAPLGLRQFHHILLKEGQIPFKWLKEKMSLKLPGLR